MRPAINDLLQRTDAQLFPIISEGIEHIVENASDLDRIAHRLYDASEIHGSNIMRGLAEEEAAKVLVLVDFVRCPHSKSKERKRTLKCFYNHIAKGIYAHTCYWRPANFKDICNYVDLKKEGFYLDGPHDVDWIFRNDIISTRDWSMYVDYVRDVTLENGEYSWQFPEHTDINCGAYISPRSLKVSRALSQYGVTSIGGLRIVADIWRRFEPHPCSTRIDLMGLVNKTIKKLKNTQPCPNAFPDDGGTLLDGWAFPLWSLELCSSIKRSDENKKLFRLRKERKKIIEHWIEIAKLRNPRPVVSLKTVKNLSKAFNEWQNDIDKLTNEYFRCYGTGLRIIPPELMYEYHQLDSYNRLENSLEQLTKEEQIDLIALAWFATQSPPNWPQQHQTAVKMFPQIDYRYQTGLGAHWLAGFRRWEGDPAIPGTFDSL